MDDDAFDMYKTYDLMYPLLREDSFYSRCRLYCILSKHCGSEGPMFNPKICYIQVGGTVLPIKLQRFFRFLKKLNFSAFNFLLFIYVYSEHIISISTSVEAIKRNRVRPKHFFQDLSILVYMIVDKKIFFIYKSQKNKIAP